jgi:N-acetylglucosaminyl-diphospho-decaprenol L-rhamnosyltransferase
MVTSAGSQPCGGSRRVAPAVVTIVVVSWDAVELLEGCLTALRRQEWAGSPPRLVVVDNASTDGTREWLADQAPDVAVVVAQRNLGFAGGANLGLAGVHSPYVAVVNNDAEVEAGWLAALVSVLETPGNERVGAVTSRVLLAGSGQVNSTGNTLTRAGRGRDRDWLAPASVERGPGEVFGFCGAAALLRRSALDEVGLFDEDLFLYYEDTDLSWRLRAAGWTVRYEPSAMATHQHASSSRVGSTRFTLWNERNSLIVFTRHAPAHLVAAVHLRRLVGLLVHSLRAPGAAVTRARWRAMGQHLRRLPRTLRERKRIWRSAVVSRAEVAQLLDRS